MGVLHLQVRKWLRDKAAELGVNLARKRQAEEEATRDQDSVSDWDADKPVDMQNLLVQPPGLHSSQQLILYVTMNTMHMPDLHGQVKCMQLPQVPVRCLFMMAAYCFMDGV